METLIYLFVVVILILLFLSKLKPKHDTKFPFESKKYLMTKAEMHFYKTLRNSLETEDIIIMSKVRLWDIFYVSKGTENRKSYENKIRSKHIDFLLCDSNTLSPLVAIELDDKSHNRKDRQKSDEFKNKLFMVTGIGLLRFPVQKEYDSEKIYNKINNFLNSKEKK